MYDTNIILECVKTTQGQLSRIFKLIDSLQDTGSDSDKTDDTILQCYKCGDTDHFIRDCPMNIRGIKRKHNIPTSGPHDKGKNSASTKGKQGKQGKHKDKRQDPKGGDKRGRNVATNFNWTSTSKATSSTQPLVDTLEQCLHQEPILSPGPLLLQAQALSIEKLRSGLNIQCILNSGHPGMQPMTGRSQLGQAMNGHGSEWFLNATHIYNPRSMQNSWIPPPYSTTYPWLNSGAATGWEEWPLSVPSRDISNGLEAQPQLDQNWCRRPSSLYAKGM